MSRTFKIILSVMTILAFTLLFVCIRGEFGWGVLPLLIIALIGALRIVWKMKPHEPIDNTDITNKDL